jgi:predicted O-methyltransferase YrrM
MDTPGQNGTQHWGVKSPAHAGLKLLIDSQRENYFKSLDIIREYRDILHRISQEPESATSTRPAWSNAFFSNLDAASLVAFLLARNPKRYVEVGSGNSTKFARYAIDTGELRTHLTSIDPKPRAQIDGICNRVIRSTLQTCDLDIFHALEPGDIVFFDGSHVLNMDSDVSVFFLEILPLLKPGVLVHVHDIFLPFDYAPVFHRRNYTEQYMLAMFLLYSYSKIVLPNYYVCQDPALSAAVKAIFAPVGGGNEIAFTYHHGLPGVSFWLETTEISQRNSY